MAESLSAESQAELNRLRVTLLFEQNGATQTIGLVNAALYTYAAIGTVVLARLVAWDVAVVGIFVARLMLRRAFLTKTKTDKTSIDPIAWERRFILGVLASACAWGAAGSLLLPGNALLFEAFVAFMLAGSTAAAAVAYATSMAAVQAFLWPCLLPMIVTFAWEHTGFEPEMAALTVLYLGLFGLLTRRLHRQVEDSIRLRFEKDRLLTELQATQALVTQSAKMAALGEMAGGIAHEVNTPLAVIKGDSHYLRDLSEANELTSAEAITIANAIDETAGRIGEIVSGLRAFAREGAGEPMIVVPLRRIVEDTLVLCQNRFMKHGIRLTVENVAPDVCIRCRPVQVSQVLLNLLNNAFDVTDGLPDAWVRIDAQAVDRMISIAVTDSGPGVPAPIRDRIMQPFFTTKAIGAGSGLGLSIAKGLAEAHGGVLTLDSTSRHTRFVLTMGRAVETERAA